MDNKLPDITQEIPADNPSPLNWVGMEGIRMPLNIKDDKLGEQQVAATVNVYVDLQEPKAKGVHMSRMHLGLMTLSEGAAIGYKELKSLMERLIEDQQGLSSSARIDIHFDMLIKRESLVSSHQGWLSYPISLQMIYREGQVQCQLGIEVIYSSTCPCSAALARQLTASEFASHFSEGEAISRDKGKDWISESEKMTAVPHSQRSLASISLVVQPEDAFSFARLVEQAEEALGIPVQAIVKREDEQEFARLNGKNLMFCEDAVRRLSNSFKDYASKGLSIRVCHLESLHSHNAIAEVKFGALAD